MIRALLAVFLAALVAASAAGAATNPWIEKTPLDIAQAFAALLRERGR